jgi:hypothetical protein
MARMTQPLDHPRLRELVSNARRAVTMRATVVAEGGDATAIDEVLQDLYRDVGKTLVGLLGPSGPATKPPVPGETPGGDLPESGDDDSWYTDEVESRDVRPLFAPEDLDEATDVPESDPMSTEGYTDPLDATPRMADLEIATIDSLTRTGTDLPMHANPEATVPTWHYRLDQLLELLALPAHLDDPAELAVEASRVQWITTELEPRLNGFPAEIQIALVGLLAARAQHLRKGSSTDVGPRLSLDRLQRYRIEADLPTVAGLLPTPRPERDGWEADIRGWWTLLKPGSRP